LIWDLSLAASHRLLIERFNDNLVVYLFSNELLLVMGRLLFSCITQKSRSVNLFVGANTEKPF
jgi:hypothetical protein